MSAFCWLRLNFARLPIVCCFHVHETRCEVQTTTLTLDASSSVAILIRVRLQNTVIVVFDRHFEYFRHENEKVIAQAAIISRLKCRAWQRNVMHGHEALGSVCWCRGVYLTLV